MRKSLPLLLLFCCLLLPVNVLAKGKVLVVLGTEGVMYRTAYQKFIRHLPPETAKNTKKIVVSRNIKRNIIRHRPDVIVAIGNNALARLVTVTKKPVIYALCTNGDIVSGNSRFFGISGAFDRCEIKKRIQTAMPTAKTIAFIEPSAVGHQYDQCKMENGLVAIRAEDSSGLPSAMKAYSGVADAVVIDSGSSLLTRETMEYLFQFSLENQIPLVSLQRRQRGLQAAMVIEIDPVETGRALADMVDLYLDNPSKGMKRVDNRWLTLDINHRTVRMLKLKIGGE